MTPPRIRPFTEADRQAVQALAGRFVDFTLPPWHDPATVLAASERLLDALSPDPQRSAVLVAEGGSGTLLGFVEVRLELEAFSARPEAYLASLAVTEAAEGGGVGRALVRAAEHWARTRGLATLSLHVFASNARARGFYAALGFQEDTLKLVKPLPGSHPSDEAQTRAVREL